MKIGIVTYVKCDNYGAELQAFALQWKLNVLGYDAEVINLEKRDKNMMTNPVAIRNAILSRLKKHGIKAPAALFHLFRDTWKQARARKKYANEIRRKHELFVDFFETKIRHSKAYYTLDGICEADLPYDVYIAGSDQIWNYIHTDRLDVYFLMFANRFKARKISYAASISIYDIPENLREKYREYVGNIDVLSVRELQGADLIRKYCRREAEVVLDPTFLLSKTDWQKEVAREVPVEGKYVLIYTLSGSPHIRAMAKEIARRLGYRVVNIKSNYTEEKKDEIRHLYEVGPREWVGLFGKASYVITDSFHGTAFSINFNIPFFTLMNPNSMMNSRVLSLLKIAGLENRIIYDDPTSCKVPEDLRLDFTPVNDRINLWREKSLAFIRSALGNPHI